MLESNDESSGLMKVMTRGEAFSKLLREHPPRRDRRPGDIVILEVRFGLNANTYCYITRSWKT